MFLRYCQVGTEEHALPPHERTAEKVAWRWYGEKNLCRGEGSSGQQLTQEIHTIDLTLLPAQATCTRPTARAPSSQLPAFSRSPGARLAPSSPVLSHTIMTPSLRLTSSSVRRATTRGESRHLLKEITPHSITAE
ncbi:hypothetical protein [Ktedonobacter sp. SOSP1-52]|uniref:hypothetical protein n=1 Tax=Ktedonobacter sp. SOSP1-52 TaxID=2778366 RepID=UPI0019156A5C|nr:hypothetical protein [Ktedonobacter sp. SOSP1-52]